MRKREVVKIDDKEIVLKELTIMELSYICHRVGWGNGFFDKDRFEKYKDVSVCDVILAFVSDISKDEIMSLAPSEIEFLYNTFRKVNEATFKMAEYMGINKAINDMRENLVSNFMSDYSKSLK